MFKKDKTLFITLILMLIIIISIILVVVVYEKKNDIYLDEINAKEKYLKSIKISKEELEEEVEKLNKEIDELKNKNESYLISQDGDMATYYQSLIELSDISLMIKEGNKADAKKELLKINPGGFDRTALSFYESLCRELNLEY